jgi:SAM-dependent methyltransferase
MTPEYVEDFATAYDRFWAPYPLRMGAAWLAFHARVAPDAQRSLLDVGCGTGIVAERFCAAGYRVVGLDVSAAMLSRARERLAPVADRVTLLQADAADFAIPQPVAFALSTYDIPNHLGGLDRVRGYLRSVHRAVLPGGWLGFDLCTVRGLRADLAPVNRDDDSVSVAVNRGALDPVTDRRPLHVSGAVRDAAGGRTHFETTITNSAYPVADVLAALADTGWADAYVAALDDLGTPIHDAEQRDRVAVIARRDPPA